MMEFLLVKLAEDFKLELLPRRTQTGWRNESVGTWWYASKFRL